MVIKTHLKQNNYNNKDEKFVKFSLIASKVCTAKDDLLVCTAKNVDLTDTGSPRIGGHTLIT